MGRQRSEPGGPPSSTAGSQLAQFNGFPLPKVSGVCLGILQQGRSLHLHLPASPAVSPPGPCPAAEVQSPPRRHAWFRPAGPTSWAHWLSCALLARRPHALRAGLPGAFCKEQLLILLAGVLAPLASPVKMKESFRKESSDSSGERKTSWPRSRLLHPGCLSLTPRGLWALVASAYALLPLSSGVSRGGRGREMGAYVVIPSYLSIHSSTSIHPSVPSTCLYWCSPAHRIECSSRWMPDQ